MANTLKCENCAFWWFNEDVRRETCNYIGPDGDAPCEREEPNDNLEGGAYGFEDEYEDEYDRNHCYPQEW